MDLPIYPGSSAAEESIIARLTRKSSRLRIPLNAYLELTYRCNLRCVHCYCVENEGEKELSTEEYKGVIDQLADSGCLVITFTGGEVFVRRDFEELAEYAKERQTIVRFYTNATLIDDRRADWIRDLSPMEVEVSLYGASEGTFRDVTLIPHSFEKCLAGARRMADRGVRVNLKTPIMTLNAHEYREIIAIARAFDMEYSFDITIAPKDNGDRHPLLYRVSDEKIMELFSDPEYRNLDEGEEAEQTETPFCHVGDSEITISPYGEVFPCIQLRKPLGSVRRTPFRDIWMNAKGLNDLRDTNAKDFKECGGCPTVQYCGRCPGLAMLEDGDLMGKSSWACQVAAATNEMNVRKEATLIGTSTT